mmetsp:Transcript_2395/g.5076  ORF Transcript_2395/g.5076 Transcript_2395/m.5076 type:complete len:262 (-) Transcript_2395:1286-2071(-)
MKGLLFTLQCSNETESLGCLSKQLAPEALSGQLQLRVLRGHGSELVQADDPVPVVVCLGYYSADLFLAHLRVHSAEDCGKIVHVDAPGDLVPLEDVEGELHGLVLGLLPRAVRVEQGQAEHELLEVERPNVVLVEQVEEVLDVDDRSSGEGTFEELFELGQVKPARAVHVHPDERLDELLGAVLVNLHDFAQGFELDVRSVSRQLRPGHLHGLNLEADVVIAVLGRRHLHVLGHDPPHVLRVELRVALLLGGGPVGGEEVD